MVRILELLINESSAFEQLPYEYHLILPQAHKKGSVVNIYRWKNWFPGERAHGK